MIILPTKPQSYLEILIMAYHITNRTYLKTFPFFILLLASSFAFNITQDWISYYNNTNQLGKLLLGFMLLIALFFLCYSFIGAVIYRIHCLIKYEDQGFIESFIIGCKKSIPLILISILYILGILFGLIFLIIPGILISIYFIFAVYLIYLNFGILTSLKESYRLVQGHWWRTAINVSLASLAIIVAILIFFVIIYYVVDFLQYLMATFHFNHPILIAVFVSAIITLFMIFIYNFSIAFMLTCIYDLQLRKSFEDNKLRTVP